MDASTVGKRRAEKQRPSYRGNFRLLGVNPTALGIIALSASIAGAVYGPVGVTQPGGAVTAHGQFRGCLRDPRGLRPTTDRQPRLAS